MDLKVPFSEVPSYPAAPELDTGWDLLSFIQAGGKLGKKIIILCLNKSGKASPFRKDYSRIVTSQS